MLVCAVAMPASWQNVLQQCSSLAIVPRGSRFAGRIDCQCPAFLCLAELAA